MNKTQTILNAVFAIAIAGLFVLVFVFRSGNKTSGETSAMPLAEGIQMPIAYLNVDSLLANYTFAQEAQEKLMTKQEDARLKLNQNARTLQNEMADFQKKYENNAFLSAERAQSEYQRLQKKQQDLEELENKLAQDIMMENQKLNIQLADSLTAFLKDFNADGRYQIIMSNNAKDNILMAADVYDITNEIVEGMNARYKK
ncbi:MAG: OmpH family outer membrane protein [Paludibacteraceae bacterium]|nr:OmpH family outer membrane protein [Paludibacteraceae bacterium]